MPQVIPVTDDSSQTFTTLGFDFQFVWNGEDGGWRMYVSQNGVLIVVVRMVINIFLLDAYALGIGDFLVINNESVSEDPTRDAWDDGSFSLLYYTEQEKNDIVSASS